ncbi:S66 peptidase family protein [Flavisolibacter nicotianae]|uniref:S66 peptidase family protein n=1 Tax=Flavisolibacter nicotianae TaxID=2364882 RepID=UPI000EB0E374|nr:LD-carboxypeptidase [Flavisolibacter nicotianae]
MKFPPYLKKGDTIGIVAPAGFMPIEKMQACIETLDSWGYTVELGATTHSGAANYFSGTDEERLADLQQMLDNKKISAILCARGGYGVSRIIDRLNFKKFKKHPKWLIGFSDITVLLSHLQARYKIASLHAPMAAAFNEGEFNNPYVRSLRQALEGEKANYECNGDPYNQKGSARGELVGGNLALLAHLVGSSSEVKTKNRILFLEDVGEYLYNVDRMLLQLKRAGKLDKLAGLIIGGFTENKDTERPFGKEVHEIIHEHVKDYTYPICFGFPVGHQKENYALKIGGRYQLSVDETTVALTEL